MPADPDAGVPARIPAAVRVTPPGKVPLAVMAATGRPVVVTLKVPAVATVKVALLALVTTGVVAVFRLRVSLGSAAPELAAFMQLPPDAVENSDAAFMPMT